MFWQLLDEILNAVLFVLIGMEVIGMEVMLVEPSAFRTDWAWRSANESKRLIDDYAATAGAARSHLRAISGKQPGDPVRAAQAIVTAVESAKPPQRLLLGNAAYEGATAKLEDLRKEFAAWEAVRAGPIIQRLRPAHRGPNSPNQQGVQPKTARRIGADGIEADVALDAVQVGDPSRCALARRFQSMAS